MSWGVFPLLFVANGVSLEGVGLIKAVYPVIWGAGQIVTGSLADRIGRKPLIVCGMLVQAAGHAVIGLGLAAPLLAGLVGSVLLGLGTAMVYPALLAAVGDVAHPSWRATSLGVYRFWRDLGYAVGRTDGRCRCRHARPRLGGARGRNPDGLVRTTGVGADERDAASRSDRD